MSTAHASFRASLESQEFARGLAKIERDTKASTGRMAADFNKVAKGGGAGHKVGGISMQAADVAVQLQGGAKMATVIAQQGSQIAQMFGPHGQILAGVLAIGAGIYSWVTNSEKANAELQETMRLFGEGQKVTAGFQAGAKEDRKAAGRARIGGDRADIGLLKTQFDEDLAKMREEFMAQPKQLRDKAIFKNAVAARTDRFEAEKGNLYDKHEESKAARQQEHLREVREHEADQMEAFAKQRREQNAEEQEARKGLEDSIREAARVEEENTEANKRMASLRSQLAQAQGVAEINRRADSGNEILGQAGEYMKPASQRTAERLEARREARAIRRTEGDILDKADRYSRRHGGSGLSQEERAERVNEMRGDVNAAKNREKLIAQFDDSQVQTLSAAMMKAALELIPH